LRHRQIFDLIKVKHSSEKIKDLAHEYANIYPIKPALHKAQPLAGIEKKHPLTTRQLIYERLTSSELQIQKTTLKTKGFLPLYCEVQKKYFNHQ
jgi:hypothetical protein